MLQKYLELLKNGLDAITGLGSGEASFLDYITAVGYEFAIVLLGILIVVVSIAVIVGPYLLMRKANKNILTKIEAKEKMEALWCKIPHFADYNLTIDSIWDGLKDAVSKLLDVDGFAELFHVMEDASKPGTVVNMNAVIKEMQRLNEKYDFEGKRHETLKKLHRQTVGLKFALLGVNIGAYVIVAMFVIPLVLMFF